jgi:hypothetical protein
MAFDYATETNPDAVVAVGDAIRGGTALAPVSDEDRMARDLEREIRLQENRRRRERERERALEAEAAQHAAAVAAAQEREAANLALRARHAELGRQREMSHLRLQATQQQAWQLNFERYANNAAHQQRTASLVGELDVMLSPPPPEPEPEIVYVEDSDRLGWGELPSWRDFRKLRQPWE